MPAVAPFRGLRYALGGSDVTSAIAPPYDVISPAQREALAARSPNNVVRVILEPERPGDGPGADRYARSAATFRHWLEAGVLQRDPSPAVYPLEQTFLTPDGRERVRRGIVAAVRLHDFQDGPVRPHENTLAGPLADRLELLRRVRANLSPVFGIFDDPRGEVAQALAPAFAPAPVTQGTTDDGTRQRLWRLEDPAAVAVLQRLLADRRVTIADGHHRYAAALRFRDEVDRAEPGLPPGAGHRYVLMYLLAASDPGLVIYPTHRLLRNLPGLRAEALVAGLARWFQVDDIEEDMRRPTGRAWAISRLAEHAGKTQSFLLVTADDRRARLVTLRADADLSGLPLPADPTLRDLDVSVLHAVVLEGLLGLSKESQDREENLVYLRDAGEAVTRTLSGECQAAFLLNPTPMWQVQAVVDAGLTMPVKSTWFHPKIPSGLVIREVDPHGPP
ncbi:MAG TPA: DUF1015 domain-containing protein [Anaeromyxobacteraceae bacterium]|nr:DUF1015 domain-containing protein [Anaeromyxobacteraceae bacterium]